MTKQCGSCGNYKDDYEFNYRNKLLGLRSSRCRTCDNEYSRQHYQEHRTEHIENSKRSRPQSTANARDFVNHYLAERRCQDCGNYDPQVLTFDHVRGKKKMNISDMIVRGYSVSAIAEEIVKCDVVCANCHILREKRRRGETERPNPKTPSNASYKKHGNYPAWFIEDEERRKRSY